MILRHKIHNRNKLKFRKENKNKSFKLHRYLLGGLLFLFIAFSVFITIQGVTSGNEITELEKKARELSEENKRLSEELIKDSSLYEKRQLAEQMGFSEPSEILYLDGEIPVAALR